MHLVDYSIPYLVDYSLFSPTGACVADVVALG